MTRVYLNAIGTAVPPNEMHRKFLSLAPMMLGEGRGDGRSAALFRRMAERSGIERRFSIFAAHPDPEQVDDGGVYRRGAFPDTGARMRLFEAHAPALALAAIRELGQAARGATHLLVSSCTGFIGPGLDFRIVDGIGLDAGVERAVLGFMGCAAAINTLRLARHIVRSDPAARVLVVNVELCTLHFREATDLEEMLSYLIFADGAAAGLVTADPAGLELIGFKTAMIPESAEHITWRIGEAGFVMQLSGALPGAIATELGESLGGLVGDLPLRDVPLWAVHPGGKSILDAVERGAGAPIDLSASRATLRDYGNMSSPTVMFVLKRLLDDPAREGEGFMLAMGPGVTVESGRFRKLRH